MRIRRSEGNTLVDHKKIKKYKMTHKKPKNIKKGKIHKFEVIPYTFD